VIFEKRTYTLRPGSTSAFWRAQETRGFEIVRPILDRLVGYFSTPFGPCDQIVHLYRFDSYDDWMRRLHGLYGVEALQPYFRTVRPLMLAQENEFLASAPLSELTPLWGNGRDVSLTGILDGESPPLWKQVIVEEHVTQLLPGRLPAYWEAWRAHGVLAGELATRRLIGVYTTLVGAQHRISSYRWHPTLAERDCHAMELADDLNWQAFLGATSDSVASYEAKLLTPAPIPALSPLFSRAHSASEREIRS